MAPPGIIIVSVTTVVNSPERHRIVATMHYTDTDYPVIT